MIQLTEESFHREILAHGGPALVEFRAGWCPYSLLIGPKLERLAERYGDRLRIGRADVERTPGVAREVGLEYVPALVLFRAGRPVRRLYGDRALGELVARVERSLVPA